MPAHFGAMLMNRRRELGVSIQQVSNTIKMRPQIIEYFETENFSAMPPRGYAQGMIASYASFLGLNPHEVVDAYFDCLDAHERSGLGGRVGRFQDPAADACPRSSNAQGRYMMVNSNPAPSRFLERPQQAGYVSESHSEHEPVAASRLRPADARRPRGQHPQGPRDGARRGQGPYRDGAPVQRDPHAARDPRVASGRSRAPQDPARRARPYGAPAGPGPRGAYPPPAARGGARPNRGGPQPRPSDRGRSGNVPSRRGGQAPRGQQQPFDPRLLLFGGLMALVLLAIIVMAVVRGCAPAPEQLAASQQAPATQPVEPAGDDDAAAGDVDPDAEADPDAVDSEGDPDADPDAEDPDAADPDAKDPDEPEKPKKTKVKVVLKGKGVVAWIEVKLDGKSVLAKQVPAPFSQEYEVTQQIDVTTNMPSDVVVYHNGEKIRYDTKVSGVAKVTVTAPKPPKEEDAKKDDASGESDATADTSGGN